MVPCFRDETSRKCLACALLLTSMLGEMVGCGATTVAKREPAQLLGEGAPASFVYASPEGTVFESRQLLGRDTILVFLTTYDPLSLAVTRRLEVLARERTPRINAVLVVLEPAQNAPLVSVYRDAIAKDLQVVMADGETLEGRGAFGDMRQIPGVVLLDRDGRLVQRGFGPDAYRAAEDRLRATAVAP